jgi:hypothetical protein
MSVDSVAGVCSDELTTAGGGAGAGSLPQEAHRPWPTDERHRIGVNHAQTRLAAKLAAQQPDGFEICVDGVTPARHESDNEYTREGGDVELGLNRRLDGNLHETRTARDDKCGQGEDAKGFSGGLCGH